MLPPERTAGDEFQFVLDRADAVVSVVLALVVLGVAAWLVVERWMV